MDGTVFGLSSLILLVGRSDGWGVDGVPESRCFLYLGDRQMDNRFGR